MMQTLYTNFHFSFLVLWELHCYTNQIPHKRWQVQNWDYWFSTAVIKLKIVIWFFLVTLFYGYPAAFVVHLVRKHNWNLQEGKKSPMAIVFQSKQLSTIRITIRTSVLTNSGFIRKLNLCQHFFKYIFNCVFFWPSGLIDSQASSSHLQILIAAQEELLNKVQGWHMSFLICFFQWIFSPAASITLVILLWSSHYKKHIVR